MDLPGNAMHLGPLTLLLLATSQFLIFIPAVLSDPAAAATTTTSSLTVPAAASAAGGAAPTPPTVAADGVVLDSSEIDSWIATNVKEYSQTIMEESKATGSPTIDPVLAAAQASVKVIKVRKDGKGDFKTIAQAVKSIPKGNNKRKVIWIGPGEWNEKILVDRFQPFVTFYGSAKSMPSIKYGGTAAKYGTWDSATVVVESDYFMAANVKFVNTAPMPDARKDGGQAVALRISGDKAQFYNCHFIGYQDTLCDDKGHHYYKKCLIQGTVDFIFGNGKSLYTDTDIISMNKQGINVITAQGRMNPGDDTGFAFVHCNVTGTGDTYLGRAWRLRPRVVFAYSYMGSHVDEEGWSDNLHKERAKTVYYAEYMCRGPGSATSGRVKYTRILSDAEARPFLSTIFIGGNKWILPPPTY